VAGAGGDRAQRHRVRDANAPDWPAIWPFFREIIRAGETIAYDRQITEAAARAIWLDGPPARTSVAVGPDGAILGSANMHPNRAGPGAHVASATFLVDPRRQGSGVGRALVLDALAWAGARGFRSMQFNAVAETNERAIGLYHSLGFAVIGTVPEGFHHPHRGYVALHIMFTLL
jgi:GNAT superfamily N-acetyltransferase